MIRTSRLLALFLAASTAMAQSGLRPSPQDQSGTPTSLTIPAGTPAKVELQDPLNSKINEVGDEITCTLVSSIIINGVIALKRGTEFRGRITQIAVAKRPQRQASMTIVLDKVITPSGEQEVATIIKSIDDYANESKMRADEEGRVKGGRSGRRTIENVGLGVGIAGVGGSPAILAGAAAGGLAGAAIAVGVLVGGAAIGGVLLTKGNEIRLAPGTVFRIEFAKPFTVSVNDF